MSKQIILSISTDYNRQAVKVNVTDLYDKWDSEDKDIELFADVHNEELNRRAIEEMQFEWSIGEEGEDEEDEYY